MVKRNSFLIFPIVFALVFVTTYISLYQIKHNYMSFFWPVSSMCAIIFYKCRTRGGHFLSRQLFFSFIFIGSSYSASLLINQDYSYTQQFLMSCINALFPFFYFFSRFFLIKKIKKIKYKRVSMIFFPVLISCSLQSFFVVLFEFHYKIQGCFLFLIDWVTEQLSTGIIISMIVSYYRSFAISKGLLLLFSMVFIQSVVFSVYWLSVASISSILCLIIFLKFRFSKAVAFSGCVMLVTIFFRMHYYSYNGMGRILDVNYFEIFNQRIQLIMTSLVSMILGEVIFSNRCAMNNLKLVSGIDALTSIDNRGYALEKINKIEKNTSVGLLIFDIDNFKSINDQFGHNAGDKVISRMADCIKKSIENHKGFVLARWGGEEFILVGKVESLDFLKNLCREILDFVRLSSNVDDIFFTTSIGGCFIRSWNGDLDKYVEHADRSLYFVKRNGKDGFMAKEFIPLDLFQNRL